MVTKSANFQNNGSKHPMFSKHRMFEKMSNLLIPAQTYGIADYAARAGVPTELN